MTLTTTAPSALSITRMVSARVPTAEGDFELALFMSNQDDKEHLALMHGPVIGASDLLVRVHSECFTGDVLGSMRLIAEAGRGMIIYLRQEGRGIGLLNKLRAYNLQDQGYDTVDANLALGHQADERDYSVAALILKDLSVRSIRLLTNNPHKIESLRGLNVNVSARVPLQPTIHADNADYLRTKAERMRHILTTSV